MDDPLKSHGHLSDLRVGHLKSGLNPKEKLEGAGAGADAGACAGAGAGAGAGTPMAEAGDAYLYFPMGRGMSSLTQSRSWTDLPPDG